MGAYEDDQAKFREKSGVVDDTEEEVDHEAPRGLPDVNPEIWRDVEPILFKGFVAAPAKINDVNVVFKSLNHHEFERIQLMSGDTFGRGDASVIQRQFDLFLSFGLLYLGDVNVLVSREDSFQQIAKMFADMPEPVRRKIISHLSEVNRRANRAVILCEAYSYEPGSRFRWNQFRDIALSSTSITGIVGTETLGMNWGQLTWRALNHLEDQREAGEREWENHKFVASAMAGKGMSKVHSQDRRRRAQEREDRVERRDKILRLALLNESPEESKGGTRMVVARTVEELQTQLRKDLRGEKDWHDSVIDGYEQRARDAYAAHEKTMQESYDAHRREFGDQHIVGVDGPKKGLTPAEVRFQMERRQQLLAQRFASQAGRLDMTNPQNAAHREKWANANSVLPEAEQPPRALPIRRGSP